MTRWKSIVSLLATAAVAISCAQTKTSITGYEHGKPKGQHTVTQILYGKFTTDSGLFDEVTMGNLDVGFKYLRDMLVALATAYFYADFAKVAELTSQMKNKGMTSLEIEKIKSAAQLEALKFAGKKEINTKLIDAGAALGPVTAPQL